VCIYIYIYIHILETYTYVCIRHVLCMGGSGYDKTGCGMQC